MVTRCRVVKGGKGGRGGNNTRYQSGHAPIYFYLADRPDRARLRSETAGRAIKGRPLPSQNVNRGRVPCLRSFLPSIRSLLRSFLPSIRSLLRSKNPLVHSAGGAGLAYW